MIIEKFTMAYPRRRLFQNQRYENESYFFANDSQTFVRHNTLKRHPVAKGWFLSVIHLFNLDENIN